MAYKFARISIEQHRQIFKQEFAPQQAYYPVAMPDGSLAISEFEILNTTNPDFAWLHDLTLVDISDFEPPDTTPPTMSGQGLLIPAKAEDPDLNLFPNNKFEMAGFVIDFTPTAQGLAIDIAYLQWEAFRKEQLKPTNNTTRITFSRLWDTVAADFIFSLNNPSQSKIIQL